MDRAKLPMHHEYKALYFRSLRAAIFIMNKTDVEDVKQVLKSKPGTSWEKKFAFDFGYLLKRIRRRVPPPTILYNRMKVVFDFFKDKEDSSTKTDVNGNTAVDKDGLTLYRLLGGTSNLESLHQYLTTSFGHTVAGPWYSNNLLTVVRHFYNWRMSRKNRPNFQSLAHYDALLINRINSLYEIISESLIFPTNGNDIDKHGSNMLRYLAARQKSSLPFLPKNASPFCKVRQTMEEEPR
mmetsp:Transcript_54574/g.63795  ORF Transcript_54574/g.63795 Transcript_54574/m.63795 type:complete len:238 (+) Transcript_54574:218-931(+)